MLLPSRRESWRCSRYQFSSSVLVALVSASGAVATLASDAKPRSVFALTPPATVEVAGSGWAAGAVGCAVAVAGVAAGLPDAGAVGTAVAGAGGFGAVTGAVAPPVGGVGAVLVAGGVAPVGHGTAVVVVAGGVEPVGGGTAVCARAEVPKVRIERTERHPTVLIFPLENSLT
jgi:hypothetical protein